uniref:Uncharacterized protein n=1 Tax=Arundo donax TaxID=35708 RepID=A0A0A9ADX6_ARUDO
MSEVQEEVWVGSL